MCISAWHSGLPVSVRSVAACETKKGMERQIGLFGMERGQFEAGMEFGAGMEHQRDTSNRAFWERGQFEAGTEHSSSLSFLSFSLPFSKNCTRLKNNTQLRKNLVRS